MKNSSEFIVLTFQENRSNPGWGARGRLLAILLILAVSAAVLFQVKKPGFGGRKPFLSPVLHQIEGRFFDDLGGVFSRGTLRSDAVLFQEIRGALRTLDPPSHEVELAEIHLREKVQQPSLFPGGDSLPFPDFVGASAPAKKKEGALKSQWWIEFSAPEHQWSGFAVPWKKDDYPVQSGDVWTFLVALEPSGMVSTVLPLAGKAEETAKILIPSLKTGPFPQGVEELRWWRVTARAVDRNQVR